MLWILSTTFGSGVSLPIEIGIFKKILGLPDKYTHSLGAEIVPKPPLL
ncbi:hypothetical protein JYB87_17065 [Shewanella avicenniae]|uniref:Uncharacterized protein n=1 Tax=Shewanella avicenniae TaxID=2814294 RepID=A0ABX7QPK3_9GAMM|nr:hypothetical protein [Shewanella avicenniae]QSX33404.1 hypothetical protein JYB87_17065 [Shewanella avicenniae]